MDELKKLYEKGDYEALLKASEGMNEPEALLLRISALLSLGRPKEGLQTLLKNREALFKAKPGLTMKSNFEIRFALEQFDEARQDLEFYKNAPYVSQEVEEALSSYPGIIRNEEKAALLRAYSPIENYDEALKSKDPYALLGTLNQMGKKGVKGHEEAVKKLLSNPDVHPDVRSFALQLLSWWGYQEEVDFLFEGKIISIVPKGISDPFIKEESQWLKKEFSALQDLSLGKVCSGLVDQLCLTQYPFFPFKEEKELEFDALLSLGQEYLGYSPKSLTKEALDERNRLSELLKKHPPLS